jgi:cytochrome c oxidase cbb3-type subunit 3
MTAHDPHEQNTPMSGHNYDGIEELDNPLPRWWVYLFYATMVFAVVYMAYYVIWGPTLKEEWEQRIAAKAPKQKTDIDYNALAGDAKAIAAGKTVFVAKCVACHGPEGQGLIGPNFTDEYWIHGKGTVSDIAEVVKKGVVEKGMLAWEAVLSPGDIAAVSAYVHSLKDTHPANPKAPEGTHID